MPLNEREMSGFLLKMFKNDAFFYEFSIRQELEPDPKEAAFFSSGSSHTLSCPRHYHNPYVDSIHILSYVLLFVKNKTFINKISKDGQKEYA